MKKFVKIFVGVIIGLMFVLTMTVFAIISIAVRFIAYLTESILEALRVASYKDGKIVKCVGKLLAKTLKLICKITLIIFKVIDDNPKNTDYDGLFDRIDNIDDNAVMW